MAARAIDGQQSLNFEEICDAAMMSIMVFDVDSMALLYLNRLALETLEISEHNLGEFYLEKLYPERVNQKARYFAEDFIRDTGFYQDMMMRRMNGVNFIANLGVSKLHEGKVLLLMFQDVTFQKKLQREVQVKQQELMRSYAEILEQNAELQSLSEAKDKLITLSSHELRTPLSAILAMTESLSLGVVEEPEELAAYHRDIHHEAKNLMSILNGMLDILKLTTKKMPFFIWQHDLQSCTEECIEELRPSLESRASHIVCNWQGEKKAYFDRVRLRPVLLALIDNAIKFSPEGSEIRIGSYEEGDFLLLEVCDQGPGIPETAREKIFEEFVTLGDIDTHSKGAGLSLAIAKYSIEQMGGHISVQARPDGPGACFVVQLPKTRVLPEEMYSEENPYEDIDF